MILAIRTDSSRAELYLLGQTGEQIGQNQWDAGTALSKDILSKIQSLLTKHKSRAGDLSGVIVYRGPGSFTGLRIGVAVANTLGFSLNVPIVGASGKHWLVQGIRRLGQARTGQIVLPVYGRPPNISRPRR